jgi:signal transduction histidine kinase
MSTHESIITNNTYLNFTSLITISSKKMKFEYKISLIYLIVGSTWIIFSDNLLNSLTSNLSILTELQTYKGWFYVVITAILLFFLLKKHLQKLRHAEQEAIKSNRLKSAFLQNISHEIRTPMNSIIGFSELLDNKESSEEEKSEYIKNVTFSSNQLLYIVEELLDISLIESGNAKLYQNKLNLNQFMDDVYYSFTSHVKNSIEFRMQKDLPNESSIIYTDEGKLRQIVLNLLTNANKYTNTGSIELNYWKEDDLLKFSIKDTGIGIPNELQADVFERFQQAHNDHKRLYEGVGLGLAICKGNIDLLGGKIWLESEPEKGSTFFFNIPYTPCQAAN